MKLYELAFFENTDNIFIPGILPIDMPDGLPAFDDAKDRLTMSFVVEKALPPSITARIIVQRSDEIFDEKLLWRKGAVLKYKNSDTVALIIEENRSITVSVKGTEKTAYIASLRETIKGIFDDYKGINPDLIYEVLIPEEYAKSESPLSKFEKEKPLTLAEDVIRGCLEKIRLYFDAPNGRDISLYDTGRAYSIPEKIKIEVDVKVDGSLKFNITTEEEKQLLEMLEKFLESEQAKKLTDKGAVKTWLAKLREEGFKKGWELLSNTAKAAIKAAVFMFLATHPEIPQEIRLFLELLLNG